MHTNLTSQLQLTDGLLTDQLTKRSRNWPLLNGWVTVGRQVNHLSITNTLEINSALHPSQDK